MATKTAASGEEASNRQDQKGQENNEGSTQNADNLKNTKDDTKHKTLGERKGDSGPNHSTRKQRGINYDVETGVADECCIKGCLYDDLLSYCG